MNPEERIKITYYTPVNDDRSQVVALFGCYVVKQDLYFSKWKLIHKKDGGLFIAPPSEKYQDPKTGQDAYSNFCWYGSKTSGLFQEAALESLKSYCTRKGIPYPSNGAYGAKEGHSEASYSQEASVNEQF